MKMHRHGMRMSQPLLKTRTTADTRLRGDTWMRIRDRVMARDCGLCVVCRLVDLLTDAEEVDHIVPLEHGGSDDDSNLQSLCKACHKAKTAWERANPGQRWTPRGGAKLWTGPAP
jgi:5-methylcytosine-specific restriction endonuclease McrA